jgi:sugar phosphate permease
VATVPSAAPATTSTAAPPTAAPAPQPGSPNAPATAPTAAPKAADILRPFNAPLMVFLIFIQVIFVTMVYAPIAAYLVEAFPAKVRYTSMSLPYHIGNGVFGGLLPTIGLFACAYTGNVYAGLIYPMIVAAITFIIGSLYLKETHKHRMWEEFENPQQTA